MDLAHKYSNSLLAKRKTETKTKSPYQQDRIIKGYDNTS